MAEKDPKPIPQNSAPPEKPKGPENVVIHGNDPAKVKPRS